MGEWNRVLLTRKSNFDNGFAGSRWPVRVKTSAAGSP